MINSHLEPIPNAGAERHFLPKMPRKPHSAEECRRATIASVIAEVRPSCVWDLDGTCMSYREVYQPIKWIPCELGAGDSAGTPNWPRASKPDLIIALGVLHRLRITRNFSLSRIAQSLENLAHWILIEFVPKEDSTVRALLRGRPESFEDYYLPNFYGAFRRQFEIVRSLGIPGTPRSIYLFKKRTGMVAGSL